MRPAVACAALVGLAGCTGAGSLAPPPHAAAALRDHGLRALADPTVRGAHLVPVDLGQAHLWGTEPGGGGRGLVVGTRFVSWPGGALVAAADRLPNAVTAVEDLPARLGGGLLYVSGTHLWRSETWLGPVSPVFTSPSPIGSVQVGLDRVYVRTQAGALGAIDPRTGARVDLGPLPPSPSVARVAALDGWRAVALADLRGAMFTLDAGATWRALDLPVDASELVATPDALRIGGMDDAHQMQFWELRASGQVGRVTSGVADEDAAPRHAPSESSARIFGERPLVAAIEDGWPLEDGTALVARDGALARVRLADGAIVEQVADAYALRPSRCHPIAMSSAADPGAFGFVCGESHGATVVLRWDAAAARLIEVRRFPTPREVLASGRGGLAVRGPCDVGAAVPDGEVAWCLQSPGQDWREMRFRGEDVDLARVVALADGRVALVRPPRAADLSTARLTLTDGTASTHVPLALPPIQADVGNALRRGVWMDGFEERRPGVLGGWIDAGGAVVGVEIDLDGRVRVGELARDAGPPFVSGRWAFGWTPSRRGFETVDGGMTWRKDLALPDPLSSPREVGERACGPAGCLAAGWVRVGWGPDPSRVAPADPPPPPHAAAVDMPALDLDCRTVSPAPAPPAHPAPAARAPSRGNLVLARPWLVGSQLVPACRTELTPFQGHAAPALGTDGCGFELSLTGDRSATNAGGLRVYTWGGRGDDWDASGRWKVAWLWPWGTARDARSSLTVPSPWTSRDAAARFLGVPGRTTQWTLVAGDDPDHALLLVRRLGAVRTAQIFALESDRGPVEVKRPGGEPFADLEGAVRVAGRWVLVTESSGTELPAAVVWTVDGANAREVLRVPRVGEPRSVARLAHRTDGGDLAIVVDGQPTLDRSSAPRWALGVDLESASASEPERLAPIARAARASLACSGEDSGWEVDVPYTGAVRLRTGAGPLLPLRDAVARVRLSSEGSCLVGLTGAAPRESHVGDPTSLPATTLNGARTIDVTASVATGVAGLRCVLPP